VAVWDCGVWLGMRVYGGGCLEDIAGVRRRPPQSRFFDCFVVGWVWRISFFAFGCGWSSVVDFWFFSAPNLSV